MMQTKDVNNKKAIKKLQDTANKVEVAMLLTALDKTPIAANPMITKKVDDMGRIWFLSSLNSEHNTNILTDQKVQLLYSKPDSGTYVSVYGDAYVESHENILKELYSEEDDTWFDGIDDNNLTAIKVVPQEAYYWDEKQNKIVSMLEGQLAATPRSRRSRYSKGKLNVH